MAPHSGILAWRIPWTEDPGGLQSIELKRVGHIWAANTRCGKPRWFTLKSHSGGVTWHTLHKTIWIFTKSKFYFEILDSYLYSIIFRDIIDIKEVCLDTDYLFQLFASKVLHFTFYLQSLLLCPHDSKRYSREAIYVIQLSVVHCNPCYRFREN